MINGQVTAMKKKPLKLINSLSTLTPQMTVSIAA